MKRFIYTMLILLLAATNAQAAQVLEGGATGETVMVLTRRLSELGYMNESVDVYSEKVSSAIGDFQQANGLERTGVAVAIDLPMTPESVQPLGAALLLLRHGEFLLDGDDAQITLTLPPETTGAVCTALVPQIESLGMTFKESTATLTIRDGSVKTAVLNAGGEVPFLVATIPLSFTAELNIP